MSSLFGDRQNNFLKIFSTKGLGALLPVSGLQIWKKWKLWQTSIIAAVERCSVSTITRAIQNDVMTLRYVTKSKWRRHVLAILKTIRRFLISFTKINTEARRVPKQYFVETFTLESHANWQNFILVPAWLHSRILWFTKSMHVKCQFCQLFLSTFFSVSFKLLWKSMH